MNDVLEIGEVAEVDEVDEVADVGVAKNFYCPTPHSSKGYRRGRGPPSTF